MKRFGEALLGGLTARGLGNKFWWVMECAFGRGKWKGSAECGVDFGLAVRADETAEGLRGVRVRAGDVVWYRSMHICVL